MIGLPRMAGIFIPLMIIAAFAAVGVYLRTHRTPGSAAAWYYEEAREYVEANLYGGAGVYDRYSPKYGNDAVEVRPGIWRATGHMRMPVRGSQFVADAWVVYTDTNAGLVIYAAGNHRTVGDDERVRNLGHP
jgi:hypothetical protein